MLREAPVKTLPSFEEYLEFETRSPVRHEFVDGSLFVMPGGTDRHNLIAGVLYGRLLSVAMQRGCLAFIHDVLVRTPNGRGYYPDVFVICDPSIDSPRVKSRPSIIIEVRSDSTEAVDRGEKWDAYQEIPSLEQYLLLSQDEALAEVFTRQSSQKWLYERVNGDQALRFPSLELELVLEELYRNLPPKE